MTTTKMFQARLFLAVLVLSLVWMPTRSALAAERAASLLPADFNGWIKSESKASGSAQAADPTNAPLLTEYGFGDFEQAVYKRNDRVIHVKAARFVDATGAYGAFSFYRLPLMRIEKIGDQGVSNQNRILFFKGNVLVDANIEKMTAMSASDLRSLADAMPKPAANLTNLPTLPRYFPKQSYQSNSEKFILGPVGLSRIDSPLTAGDIDFSIGAEVASGKYSTSSGMGTLTLISYPTPQIAAEKLQYFSTRKGVAPGALSANSEQEKIVDVKRTGPIVAIASGDMPASEARSLLASVNYDADVTWTEPTFQDRKNNIGDLIVNIFTLIGVILLFALITGIAFGGVKILSRKFFPNRLIDRPEDAEFIRLDLRE